MRGKGCHITAFGMPSMLQSKQLIKRASRSKEEPFTERREDNAKTVESRNTIVAIRV